MQLLRNLNNLPETIRGGAVSIGNFDGVHLGHARIVEQLKRLAAAAGGPSVVFTFDPHPVRLLRPELTPPPLTWTDRKAELLGQLGVDFMVAYPTDDALLALTPDEFFQQIIVDQLNAQAMVEGPNFFFGKDRAGDISTLGQLSSTAGVHLQIAEPLQEGKDFVSSSRIRRLIAAGDLDGANALLTQPYRLRGMVTHGAARGGKIGFPTANVAAIDTILPGMGVYAGAAYVEVDPDGLQKEDSPTQPRKKGRSSVSSWPAAINVGPQPTFDDDEVKVEVHLHGYDGSLYGQPLEVDIFARLRDIQPFDRVEALQAQLNKDVQRTIEVYDHHR